MDSITQIALGAAFGEATVGQKAGKKGAIWGAVLGTLPDLDVVANLFLDPVSSLAVHRGASHSYPVILIASPIIAWILSRIHRSDRLAWRDWTLMVFVVLASHIFIDLVTVYGTQIFWPFTDHPFGIDSIFIVDPLFTLPLVVGLLLALRAEVGSKTRMWRNSLGILIATLYLTWGMGVKGYIHSVFKQGLAAETHFPEKIISSPTVMNSVLWQGLALDGDTIRVGLVSIFDNAPPRSFIDVPRNSHLLEGHEADRAVERLLWFSKGFYSVEADSLGLRFTDYRFGRNDAWLHEDGTPIFHWRLIPDSTGTYTTFQQIPTLLSSRGNVFADVFDRAKGR